METIPETKISINELEALKPGSNPGAETLTYPGIGEGSSVYDAAGKLAIGAVNTELNAAEPKQAGLWQTVEHGDGIDPEAAAHEIARYNLVRSARKIHGNGTDRVLWSERYNQASIELYGGPEVDQATSLTQDLLVELSGYKFDEGSEAESLQREVVSVYDSMIASQGPEQDPERQDPLESMVDDAKELGTYLKDKYADVFALVEDDEAVYGPEEQAGLAAAAVQILAQEDPEWNRVKVKMDPKAAHLSVSSRNEQDIYMSIGANRPPATGLEMKGLLIHELVWHLGRGLNGWKVEDQKLASGMPGYESFEEGGGVYAEVAVTGVMPTKHKDRYVDIAIAMGTIDGERISRSELSQLVAKRNLIRLAAKNNGQITGDMEAQAQKAAHGHVDRMYKGGLGDDSEAGRAGVFTKDVIYYGGAVSYHDRDKKRQEDGAVTAAQMFEFDIASGKIVATNEAHTDYVATKGVVLAA